MLRQPAPFSGSNPSFWTEILNVAPNSPSPSVAPQDNAPDQNPIVVEEEACLERIQEHLRKKAQAPKPASVVTDYDQQLISLRDQIGAARLEDVPPLVEQMERVAALAAQRRITTEGYVDPVSPYFGRLVLQEGERQREVLIGRSTYLDTKSGVRIVDWRDAPISRLYYRYEEGEDYVETFGDREVEGDVVTRRSLAIAASQLKRIVAPQGTFVKSRQGTWKRSDSLMQLTGGQGSALRAEHHHKPGQLGVGADDDGGDDKHLKEITSLIDRRQFELITQPDSGLVVIQGGAGSGKTTIGLHRLAYLAFQDKRRFRGDKMLIVVFNDALARYISRVLPALGVSGVPVRTYEEWASRLRILHLGRLPRKYSDDTPAVVTRLKKHPVMLRVIDVLVARLAEELRTELAKLLAETAGGDEVLNAWDRGNGRPLTHRVAALSRQFGEANIAGGKRATLDTFLNRARLRARDVVSAWADLLTDLGALRSIFEKHAPDAFSTGELKRAHAHMTAEVSRVLDHYEDAQDAGRDQRPTRVQGVDGHHVEDVVKMDREDDTLLLRLLQQLRGPLMRGKGKEALVYEHVLVDEAQDLSPVELAVVVHTISKARSITLCGDVAQRLHMDNGFTDWDSVLGELGLSHVAVEPLKLSYRSTEQIVDVARAVLGPLAPDDSPVATKTGAPVELFRFSHTGDAVGFLAEALRGLIRSEPGASVAVIARFPEQADMYFEGLRKAEVPHVRRIADQDFPFRAGIDVTDARQVKGLEFDYVIVVEATKAVYPADDESRHLLHIVATRAAHQLWFLATGEPSALLPEDLRDTSY